MSEDLMSRMDQLIAGGSISADSNVSDDAMRWIPEDESLPSCAPLPRPSLARVTITIERSGHPKETVVLPGCTDVGFTVDCEEPGIDWFRPGGALVPRPMQRRVTISATPTEDEFGVWATHTREAE